MKKINILLLCLCMIFPLSVSAEADISSTEEGKNQASTSITIGSVAVPIYEVYMIWEEPTFDYVYDEDTKTFGWAPSPICYDSTVDDLSFEETLAKGEKLYTNNSCTIEANSYEEGTQYYKKFEREDYSFGIEDFSQNGTIVPSITWNSNPKYDYVDGKFYYYTREEKCTLLDEELFNAALGLGIGEIYNNDSCSTLVENANIQYEDNKYYAKTYNNTGEESELLPGEELPDSARLSASGYDFVLQNRTTYSIRLKLTNKTIPSTTPTAGDELGTITVTIRAA